MASSVGGQSAANVPRFAVRGRSQPRASRALLWLVVPVAVHLGVVLSIVRQPLHPTPAAARSVIWTLHNDSVHRLGPAADFFAIVHAGHSVERGRSPYLTFERPRATPYFYPYRYLPPVAHSLGRLATRVSPRVAWWLWVGVSELLLAVLLVQLARRARDPSLAGLLTAVLLLSSPYFLELYMGQFTFVSVGLLALALLWLGDRASERVPWGGALTLAVALLLKPVGLAAAPAFLRHRQGRIALLFAGSLLVGLTAPYFAMWPREWAAFVHLNFVPTALGLDSGNFGVVYLGHLVARDLGVGGSSPGAAFAAFFHPTLLCGTALVVLLSRSNDAWLAGAVLVLAHFASYVHVWEHHMSAVVLLGSLMLCGAFGRGADWRSRWVWVVAGCVVVLALPTPFALIDRALDPAVADPSPTWSPLERYALVLSKAAPLVVLYGAGMVALCRAGFALPWRVATPSEAAAEAR